MLVALAAPWPAQGQVVLDGTLGASGAVAGRPNYAITEGLGRRVGSNLFHSFSTFNVGTGESATFSGAPGTTNVISRVTGPGGSSIDGTLRSTIAGANVYLINPKGVAFGPNARLDVGGSFHASTAGYIRLGADGRFDAVDPGASRLTVDPPAAFGFLGSPAPLSLDRSLLHVPFGRTISLVGGKLSITGGPAVPGDCGFCNVWAPGGKVYLAAAGSAGEVTLKSGGIGSTAASSADITLKRAVVLTETGGLAAPGPIFIRGGTLTLDATAVSTLNQRPGGGGNIDIALAGDLVMRGGSKIRTSAQQGGDAGDVRITAANVDLSGAGTNIETSSVDLNAGIGGRAGGTTIDATGAITLSDDATITSISFFGAAGEMRLRAGSVNLLDGGNLNVSTFGNGNAGRVLIEAGSVTMRGGGHVLAATLRSPLVAIGTGAGGDIVIDAGSVDISGAGSGLFSVTETIGSGGTITIRAGNVRLGDQARISSASSDPDNFGFVGDAGSIAITAGSMIQLESGASISTEALTGGGGVITLRAADVLALSDSSITTSVADGAGNGGDINIDPVFVVLNNSRIIARAVGGNGGDITIVTQFLITDPASVIDASSQFGLSGNVVVTAPEVDVSSRLATLSSAYVDPASRLRESCATRAGAGNSFVGVGRGGLPASPQGAAFAAYGTYAPLAALPAATASQCRS